MIKGIVTIDSMVDNATKRTERSVSPPNFAEKIVVVAPTGALAPITETKKTFPLIPRKYNIPKDARGNIINLKTMHK